MTLRSAGDTTRFIAQPIQDIFSAKGAHIIIAELMAPTLLFPPQAPASIAQVPQPLPIVLAYMLGMLCLFELSDFTD